MSKINKDVLKRLREKKGWSQEDLALKTSINKQTISRLERGTQETTRPSIIKKLAPVLGVDPGILTGEAPLSENQQKSESVLELSRPNVRISTAAHNALYLVSERYNVAQSDIVELAPFLFCWAAEASLRDRKERIQQVEKACESARALESQISHLPVPNFTYSEEKIAAEHASIEARDLFGIQVEDEPMLLDRSSSFNEMFDNPFAAFLENLAQQFADVMTFEGWASYDFPFYRACPEEAARLIGGDHDSAEQILKGSVALSQMPKEIRESFAWKERAAWVRGKIEEYRQELMEQINRPSSIDQI